MYILRFLFLSIFSFLDTVDAEELKGLGVDLISTVENEGGREELVLKEIFQCMGDSYSMSKVPYGRHVKDFIRGKYDFVTTVPSNYKLSAHQTDSHIEYLNGFVVNAKSKIELKKLTDFKNKRMITFKGASDLIPELKKIIPELASYKEHTKQKLHVKMLAQGRVDVVLSDALIFEAYTKELKRDGELDKSHKFSFIDGLMHSKFSIYFKNKKKKINFNKCLKKMKGNGVLKRINSEYLINRIYMNI